MQPECSIIMPAYNEGEGLIGVIDEVADVMTRAGYAFEIIIIDDGSVDTTWAVIEQLRNTHPQIKALQFSRNFGHQLAVHAGIKAASGRMVAVMDADGQDPPALLPVMFRKLNDEGYDVVNCVRKKRKESALKRGCYYLFYRLYQKLVPFRLQVDSGDFSAMNRQVADVVAGIAQHTPFIRGIRAWAGGAQIDLPYERNARQAGETKYSFLKLVSLALDGITSFSKVPLRMSILVGMIVSSCSVVYAIFVFFSKLLGLYPERIQGWASQTILIAFLGGMTLTVLGIIGEYLGHIFDAVRGMPVYRVHKSIGFDNEQQSVS